MLPERPESEHIVHVGTFGNWDCTDPHFTWHQLVEAYIEASGIAWTHLHPNVFMEVLANFMHIRNDVFRVYWGDRRVGWIAARDIAAVAATVLCEGPQKQGGQNYWLSAQVAARRIDERNVVPWGDFGSGVGVHSVPSPATRSERKSNPVRNFGSELEMVDYGAAPILVATKGGVSVSFCSLPKIPVAFLFRTYKSPK